MWSTFREEQPIMTRIRSKQQRHVGFEALEGRVALSAGNATGTALISLHADTALMSKSRATISASFAGRVQISGSKLTVNNLKGTIGNSHFTGHGTGTAMGKKFAGGTVYLSNATGSIELSLGPVFVVKAGKRSKQEVSVRVVAVSRNYAQYAGLTGTLTKWNLPAKPNGSASFSGYLNI
jgi:hypothetical protein